MRRRGFRPYSPRLSGTDDQQVAAGSGPWEREEWLDGSDWGAIDALLAGKCPGDEGVRASVAALEVMTHEPLVSTGRLVNPLLDLWAAARVVGNGAAGPAEALLSVLPGRRLVASSEVAAVCDQTLRAVGSPVAARPPSDRVPPTPRSAITAAGTPVPPGGTSSRSAPGRPAAQDR